MCTVKLSEGKFYVIDCSRYWIVLHGNPIGAKNCYWFRSEWNENANKKPGRTIYKCRWWSDSLLRTIKLSKQNLWPKQKQTIEQKRTRLLCRKSRKILVLVVWCRFIFINSWIFVLSPRWLCLVISPYANK